MIVTTDVDNTLFGYPLWEQNYIQLNQKTGKKTLLLEIKSYKYHENVNVRSLLKLYKTVPREKIVEQIQRIFKEHVQK